MESIARDKFNLLKNKFFKKDTNDVTATDGEESSGLLNANTASSSNVSLKLNSASGTRGNDDTDSEEENKTVGRVLQKFSDLKSRFFNKNEYKNVNEQENDVNGNHNHNENSVSTDEEPEVSFRGRREISIFRDNFQKLKNKLFKDNSNELDQIQLIKDPLSSNWLDSKDTPSKEKTTVLTRSSDVRSFFANDSDSDDGFGVGNGVQSLPGGNFFDSCAEDDQDNDDDDDDEIELFSYPTEKLSLLDGRNESEELLDMNDVDVIDLQADGSAVNLSAEESPDDLMLRSNRNRKMQGSYNVYLIVAAFIAALGGMLFGYDTGIVAGALLQLTEDFGLSCLQQETVVSSLLIGAIIASLTGGFIIDYMGRRVTIIINAMVFILGAIVLAVSPNFTTLVIGRLIVGFGVSLSASAECIYISEISPASIRGRLVSLNELGITVGFLIAYSTSYLFIHVDNGWRYMFGLSAIPAMLQGIGMFFMPPSPRFLFMTGKPAEAQMVLKKIHGNRDYETEMSSIQTAQTSFQGKQIFELCSSTDNMRTRLAIGMGILFFQQFTGQPSVLYYVPTLFESIGYGSNTAAALQTVGLGIVKVVMTVISLLIVDRCGRRCLLLVGTALMFLGITMLGITTIATPSTIHDPCHIPLEGSILPEQSNISSHPFTMTTTSKVTTSTLIAMTTGDPESVTSGDNNTQLHKRDTHDYSFIRINKRGSQANLSDENSVISSENNTQTSDNSQTNNGSRWISLVALMMYIAGYAVGFGPVSWLVLSELYPSHVRGRAISVSTVFNWGTNLVVALTFLNLMSALNVSGIFFLYGGICLVSLLFIFLFVPETKGRTLEQLSHQLQSRRFIAENVAVCSKCCDKDGDEESLTAGSRTQDYAALQ